MNSKFLNRIDHFSIPIIPTENIDELCKLAAAVIVPSLIHRLNFKPNIFVDIISLALFNCFVFLFSSCDKYKFSIYRTNSSAMQGAFNRKG